MTMIEQNKAQISALMDGELDDMAVKKLLEDKSIKQTWQRYHIISDVIQNRVPINTSSQLALRISELIKNEPAIVAPSRQKILNYFKPVAGAAVAATVAAMAILAVQQYRADDLTPATPVAVNIPVPAQVNQVGVPVQIVQADNVRQVRQQQLIESNPDNVQIRRYLLNHNEYQMNMGVHGAVPHVRLVTIDRK